MRINILVNIIMLLYLLMMSISATNCYIFVVYQITPKKLFNAFFKAALWLKVLIKLRFFNMKSRGQSFFMLNLHYILDKNKVLAYKIYLKMQQEKNWENVVFRFISLWLGASSSASKLEEGALFKGEFSSIFAYISATINHTGNVSFAKL